MLVSPLSGLFSLGFFLGHALTAPAPAPAPASYSAPTHDIYQFPNKGTWVENLAVRANGQILITRLDAPVVQQVDPFSPGKAPTTIHTFPSLGLVGITEIEPDVFAVVTTNFSLTLFSNQPGAFSVWKVDVRPFFGPGTFAKVSKITDIPEASFVNGATTLDPIKGIILIADSQLGSVFRVDTHTGAHSIIQKDATMAPSPTARLPIGINGLRARNGYLYFTSSNQNLFVRVPINPDGSAAGAYQVLTTNTVGAFDDFALDIFGTAYICQGTGNSLAKITINGNVGTEQEIAGNATSTVIAGNTSAKFGRTLFDLRTLYVTTNGGLTEGPAVAQGAKIVAVEVGLF